MDQVTEVLLHLCSGKLLASPEPSDPQDAIVARQYIDDNQLFMKTAKQWTETYAKVSQEKLIVSYNESYRNKYYFSFMYL